MFRLGHATDTHFNFMGTPLNPSYKREGEQRFPSPRAFGQHLAETYPDLDALLITGDIAEADCVERQLKSFLKGFRKRVYFVLGNHDYYGGSFEGVHARAEKWSGGDLVWLTRAGVIELTPTTALCGHEGWYDGRAADPSKSKIDIWDFKAIRNFRGKPESLIHQEIRILARNGALKAAATLRIACVAYKHVIFATHVPPFPEATFHEGAQSDRHWLPWMCNVTLGEHLLDVAAEFPETQISVYCGHTHSPGKYHAAPNLTVTSGISYYWYPRLSDIIDLDNSEAVITVP